MAMAIDVQKDIVVDSLEGIRLMMHFARNGGFVLNEYHEEIAKKWGVPTDGVRFARASDLPR
jgi:hypothetical protein